MRPEEYQDQVDFLQVYFVIFLLYKLYSVLSTDDSLQFEVIQNLKVEQGGTQLHGDNTVQLGITLCSLLKSYYNF